MAVPIPKKISQILPTFQNVAQTSHYIVDFGLPAEVSSHLRGKGFDSRFDIDKIGLLCSKAVLPGSAFATIDAVGEYQGVVERFPHTKKFVQMQLEFYVDNEYKALKFLEHWMEYISNGSNSDSLEDAYHYRMNYPITYKSQTTTITKFEKNYRQTIEYGFRGLYPIELNSTVVQYQNSQVLKATAAFNYDRYICGKTRSWDRERGIDRNNGSLESQLSNNLKGPVGGERYLLLNPGQESSTGAGNKDLFAGKEPFNIYTPKGSASTTDTSTVRTFFN